MHVLDVVDARVALERRSRRSVRDSPVGVAGAQLGERGTQLRQPVQSRAGARVFVVVEHHRAVGIGDRNQ